MEDERTASSDNAGEIEEAVAADAAYSEYLDEQVEEEVVAEERRSPNPNATQYKTGIVTGVEFLEESRTPDHGVHDNGLRGPVIEITVERSNGKTFTQEVEAAQPSETGSEWVRLCDYTNTAPHKPSDLIGAAVPIRVGIFEGMFQEKDYVDDDKSLGLSIDIPPVMKRLNPLGYRVSRWLYELDVDHSVVKKGDYGGDVTRPSTLLFIGRYLLIPLGLAVGSWTAMESVSQGLLSTVAGWSLALSLGALLLGLLLFSITAYAYVQSYDGGLLFPDE